METDFTQKTSMSAATTVASLTPRTSGWERNHPRNQNRQRTTPSALPTPVNCSYRRASWDADLSAELNTGELAAKPATDTATLKQMKKKKKKKKNKRPRNAERQHNNSNVKNASADRQRLCNRPLRAEASPWVQVANIATQCSTLNLRIRIPKLINHTTLSHPPAATIMLTTVASTKSSFKQTKGTTLRLGRAKKPVIKNSMIGS